MRGASGGRRLRGRARGPARRRRALRPHLPGPGRLLLSARRRRARLLLFVRRAARHADGSRPGALGRRDRERVARGQAGLDLPRARGGATFSVDRPRDRSQAAAGDHLGACRRDPGVGTALVPVRTRPSREADVPGDPDRGQRRARVARPCAARRVGPPARRGAHGGDQLSLARGPRPGAARGGGPPARGGAHGGDQLSLAGGPPCQAVLRRPRPRVHLPPGAAGLRLRTRARSAAALTPRGAPRPRRARAKSALGIGATAGRAQDHAHFRGKPRLMSPAATAAARAARPAPARTAARTAPARTAPRRAPARPAPSRRPRTAPRSHPARRARAAPAPARGVRLFPFAVGRTAAAVSSLADTGVLFRLTRGRLWIATLTTLLVGIVALNVMELSFGAAASGLGRQADVLKREDSILRTRLAGTLSDERIQQVAGAHGLINPAPGSIGYLKLSSDDAAIAAKRLAQGDLTYGSPEIPASDTSLIPPPATTAATTTTDPLATTTTTPTTTTATTMAATTTTPVTTTTTPVTTTATTTTATATATTASGGGVSAP